MTTEGFKRKLTAILSADVVGYSRLMGDDEEATIRTITAYRSAMGTLIQQYRGRVVDTTGDNLLAEFISAVDAVNCAVEIQRDLAERNADLSYERRMEFRIGINVGDVVEEEDRIYGDGVNIAARVEGLAEAGGICISGRVYDQVENKLDLEFEFLGEQEVKNIAKPVRVYRVLSYPGAAAHRVVKAKRAVGKTWRNVAMAIAAIVVVCAAVAIWHFYYRAPPIEPASKEKMAYPLPKKPSIAVLPLTNLSGDKEQEYFSDGLTEEIITALSKVPSLFVIARNSTFTYKGKPVKVKQVAEELGVQYVLEGSVRKYGDKVRITAQLIDALKGHHLWAESYERDLKDIFALQDELTLKILRSLLEIGLLQKPRIKRKTTHKLEAYLKGLKGLWLLRQMNRESNAAARRMFKEAIAIDQDFPSLYQGLAFTHLLDVWFGSSKSIKQSLGYAFKLSKKAVDMDDSAAGPHGVLSFVYTMMGKHDKAIGEGEMAVALDPNSADAHLELGNALRWACRFEKAIAYTEKAIRLNPISPARYLFSLALVYRDAQRYEEAIAACKKALSLKPNHLYAQCCLASSYSLLGRKEEARAVAAEILKIDPKFSLAHLAKVIPYKNKAHLELVTDSLRKAGLPETPQLPLPDKPSIAVLPFVNMSGDPKQDYFSDGITEEIITALSKIPKLFVIARHSSFTYKGKSIWVPTVGKELGVRYVLEGSVRRAEDKLRITAQLIDAKTNHHLWAERYDRPMEDVFAVQDEITKKIITALQVKLTEGEQARVFSRGTNNLQAYLKLLKGREQMNRFNKEGNALARETIEKAIAIDPQYPVAYLLLAMTYFRDVLLKSTSTPKKSIAKSIELVQKAITMDGSLAEAHGFLGALLGMTKNYEKAVAQAERAVALNPNSADAHSFLAVALNYSAGKHGEAIAAFKKAIRLNPIPPLRQLLFLALACRDAGRYEEAIQICLKIVQKEPDYLFAHTCLASCYALMGKDEEARAEAAEVLRIDPKFSVDHLVKVSTYKYDVDRKRLRDSLRKAGLK